MKCLAMWGNQIVNIFYVYAFYCRRVSFITQTNPMLHFQTMGSDSFNQWRKGTIKQYNLIVSVIDDVGELIRM